MATPDDRLSKLAFSKYEGTGNDFVVVDESAFPSAKLSPLQVQHLCDRHRGIGADGVLVVSADTSSLSEETGRARMTVYNADGSRAAMCGNGIRCVMLYIARELAPEGPRRFDIDTDAGVHACSLVLSSDSGLEQSRSSLLAHAQVAVTMRSPSLRPQDVSGTLGDTPLIDTAFDIAGRLVPITAVSMGNPHAVLFDIPAHEHKDLAEALSQDPRFDRGVNVGFATMTPSSSQALDLHVFERGAGWTEACGTGACAAAYAAVVTGRCVRSVPVCVALPGGSLTIYVGEEQDPIKMQGPVNHVFDGTLALKG